MIEVVVRDHRDQPFVVCMSYKMYRRLAVRRPAVRTPREDVIP